MQACYLSEKQLFQPVNVLHFLIEVAKAGKLPSGKTEFPFEVPLKPRSTAKMLYETYQGVYVNVSVSSFTVSVSVMWKQILKTCILVHNKSRAENWASQERQNGAN